MRNFLKSKSFVPHPIFFGIFPILFLFSHNIDKLNYIELLTPLIIILITTVIFLFIFSRILKSWHKASIITSIWFLIFFSYGHFRAILRKVKVPHLNIYYDEYLLSLSSIILILIFIFLLKSNFKFQFFSKIFNFISSLLLFFLFFQIIKFEFYSINNNQKDLSLNFFPKKSHHTQNVSEPLPSIYYFILDGYANNTTLKQVYDFDNSKFTDYFKRKGFYFASKSRSNYATTALSLASSLNMKYVNYLSKKVGLNSNNYKVLYEMARNSKVMNSLKMAGYKFIHFGSGYGATIRNKYADVDLDCGRLNEFLVIIVKTSMLAPFAERLGFLNLSRQRILNTFIKIKNLVNYTLPVFVTIHMVTPHPPYLFNKRGLPVQGANLKYMEEDWKNRNQYIEQLIFINGKVEQVIEYILFNSKIPPVIIVQADHGTSSLIDYSKKMGKRFLTKEMLKERFGILNLYYFPGKSYSLLYDKITPVNSFRILFNLYFNKKYELLKDKCYYSDFNHPYIFHDVTEVTGF